MSKRHVILNKAIMKNFTYETKLTYELNLRDKIVNSKSIRFIGSIEEYYPTEIEEILMNIENEVSALFSKLISDNLLDKENIKKFYRYILLMMLRNPTLSKKILVSSTIPIVINKDLPAWHHQLVSISLKYIEEIIKAFSPPKIIINNSNEEFINSCSGVSVVSFLGIERFAFVVSPEKALILSLKANENLDLKREIYQADAANVRIFNLSIAKNEMLGYFKVVFSRKKEQLNELITQLD